MQKLTTWAVPLCVLWLPGGCGGGNPAAPSATSPASSPAFRGFDSMTAYSLLTRQVEFGPRPPGSEAHEKLKVFLVQTLKQWATVTEQTFTQRVTGTNYTLTNILALIPAAGKPGRPAPSKRFLLGAHWDTRPTADRETDPALRTKPIPGANDGASGVAVLLEIARILHDDPPPVDVVLALWDGEDFGDFIYGSSYFATHMGDLKPDWAVNIDMVGDADLHIQREKQSLEQAPTLFQTVLDAARELGFADHFDGASMTVIDDHVPLLKKGIPSVDLIDFQYGPGNRYWHTLQDTPDKCSADSLRVVGETLLRVVYGMQETGNQ